MTQNRSQRRRKPGRPPGPTQRGTETRGLLYETAIALIARRGYEATTLREIAKRAGVSVGLLYKYFPSKRAVVLALYDALSAEYEERASAMKEGSLAERFIFALRTSLQTLQPHRPALSALVPVLVSDGSEGLFASATAFSRQRVQAVFQSAVEGAADAPRAELTPAVGRLLYLVHLAVILFWLLDRSPGQRATQEVIALIERVAAAASLALGAPQIGGWVLAGDALFRRALFGPGDRNAGGGAQ